MSQIIPLPAIAAEKNWMEFALLLEAAMARHADYGLPNPVAVRARIGRMRNQLPSSLAIALKAAEFLRRRHPAVLASRDDRIGSSHILLLARIDEIAPATAAELAQDVFSRRLRQNDLRALLRDARSGPSDARAA